MDLILDLLQGAGIAAAIGIRPFLPVLLVGALASGDLGIDFEGTDFAFLEEPGFLLGVVLASVAWAIAERRFGSGSTTSGPAFFAMLAAVCALGAVEAAGSLADRDHPIVIGVIAGAICAAIGLYAAESFLARVRKRLDAEAGAALPLYAEAAALAAAGLSVLFPPLAVVVIAALLTLLLRGGKREGKKFAGLRILR